ncbi:unnamed protein product [Clonostachys solani]|uniref:Uncharacterized protein n=1 Tax=Clonostachys solani TaxID=160281 RepID=A0A9N9Z5V8_9HYPO|nr:unnamed protein product [Clonostachys solani]
MVDKQALSVPAYGGPTSPAMNTWRFRGLVAAGRRPIDPTAATRRAFIPFCQCMDPKESKLPTSAPRTLASALLGQTIVLAIIAAIASLSSAHPFAWRRQQTALPPPPLLVDCTIAAHPAI